MVDLQEVGADGSGQCALGGRTASGVAVALRPRPRGDRRRQTARNSDAQIAAIAASIKEWGCTTPALDIANYVEITSGAPRERTEITLLAEGKVELVMGRMSSGQGHEISFAQLVTEWGKSPNTFPPSRGRAHAREAAGNQRPWPADKVERWPR
jgi:hypothetical protein